MGLGNYVIPRGITGNCRIRYMDVTDPRLSIERSVGDLVAAYDFCTPLDPPWKVKIIFSYECDETPSSNVVYPATHYLKVGIRKKNRHNPLTINSRKHVQKSNSACYSKRN